MVATSGDLNLTIDTGSGAAVFGRIPVYPGADVAISVMPPIPTEWWFLPVSSA